MGRLERPGGLSLGPAREEMLDDHPEEVLYSKGAQVRYRRILDLQPAAIHVVDAGLRLVFFNTFAKDWAQRLGYSLTEEDLGRNLFDLFPFLGRKARREYQTVFSEGRDLVTEEKIRGPDRNYLVRTQKIPVFQDAKVTEIITIIRDMTDIRETEQRLKSSEERFKLLFEFAPVAYYLSDRKGTFLDGNRAAEELIGYKKEDLIGRSYLQTGLLPKDQRPIAAKILAQAVLGRVTGPYEIELIHKSGGRVVVEVSNIPIKLSGKTRILGIAVDVTQRKLAQEKEKALVKSLRLLSEAGMKLGEVSGDEDIFQRIGEQLHALVGECYVGVSDYHELEGVIEVKALIGAKAYFRDILKIMGRNPIGMRFQPAPEAVQERLQTQQLRKIPGGLHEVTFFSLPKAMCTALERLTQIRAVYSVGFIRQGVIYGTAVIFLRGRETFENRDLIESFIHQASVSLQRWKAEKRIAASLKEKEVLLREIHHRVKNNMQIISSLLRLQSSGISDKRAKAAFQASQDRIRSMALVHEGLYRSSDLARIDFAEYARSLAARLSSLYATRGRTIAFHIDIKDIDLDVNRAVPCGLIVSELVSNALKHGFPEPTKGEIRIRMVRDKRGCLRLSVADSGIGFPAEIDFRKTNSLGLQIVNDLVQQLNGSIRLKANGGTTFIIRF
jgi:PAS domain S-box-containing protein